MNGPYVNFKAGDKFHTTLEIRGQNCTFFCHSIFTDNMETKQLIEFEVSERISIKKFVEGIGFDFVKGNAFYQLTKKETIQDYKNIVAKRQSDGCMITGTVYTLGHTYPEQF